MVRVYICRKHFVLGRLQIYLNHFRKKMTWTANNRLKNTIQRPQRLENTQKLSIRKDLFVKNLYEIFSVLTVSKMYSCFVSRFIDLDKIITVQDQAEEKQDKNKASFSVVVDKRNYELMARDTEEKQKWVSNLLLLH